MPKLRRLKNLRWLWLSVVIIVLDQWSKYYAVKYLTLDQPHRETSFLNFTLARNTGASFSFLSNAGGWQVWVFSLIAIVVCIGILCWLARLPAKRPVESAGLALIFGGALGNLFDRIRLAYVNDFIDFHWHQTHFAVFNIADSAVTIGVMLLIIALVLRKNHD
jgi:signal peptidase II